jgi:hypothetical protein
MSAADRLKKGAILASVIFPKRMEAISAEPRHVSCLDLFRQCDALAVSKEYGKAA